MVVRISFQGVPAASPFAITVAQHGVQADGATDHWGDETPGVTATIRVRRSKLKVAPEGMMFSVDLDGFDAELPADEKAYDPAYHDLYYFWDFGDPTSRFTAPQNAMEHQRNANLGFGPVVAHVFGAGAYTVRVTVIEPISGKVAKATYRFDDDAAADDVRVKTPAEVFAVANTLFIDPDGAGISPVLGATVPATNLWLTLEGLRGQTSPTRIILREGVVHDLKDYTFQKNHPSLYIEGQAGTQPVIRWAPGLTDTFLFRFNVFDPDDEKDVVFTNFRAQGDWDETTEKGQDVLGITQRSQQGSYFLMNDCVFDGFTQAFSQNTNANNRGLNILNNSIISNWRNFGVYEASRSASAYLGMCIARSSEVLGGGPKNYKHNDHGPMRFDYNERTVLDGCDLFSSTGWFENIPGYRTHQACVRWNQAGVRGPIGNIQRCTMEGGWPPIYAGPQNNNFPVNVQNLLIDRCYFIGSHMSHVAVSTTYGGVSMRNCVMVHPNVPRIAGQFAVKGLLGLGYNGSTTHQDTNLDENRSAPVRAYSNTLVSLMASDDPVPIVLNVGTPNSDRSFTNAVEDNNIVYAPSLTSKEIADEPFDMNTLTEMNPREAGHRSVYERINISLPDNISDTQTIVVPYADGRDQSDYPSGVAFESHDFHIQPVKYRSDNNDTNDNNNNDRIRFKGSATFAFNPDAISITNTSGAVWPAGPAIIVFYCPDSPPPRATAYKTPDTTTATFAPLQDSEALGTARDRSDIDLTVTNNLIAVGDFYGNLRPEPASRGAFEMAEPE